MAQGDPALGEIVRESDKTSFNYVIQGRRPGVTNEVVAFELNDLMNGIHSDLYAKDEPISCNIVYRLKGERNYDVLPD